VSRNLTPKQIEMLAWLRKGWFNVTADAAEEQWKNGKSYYLDTRLSISITKRRQFDDCNKQAAD